MPHRFFAVALLLALLALVGDANANMAKWWREGEFHGPLVPQDDTDVRVDSENLSFVVAPTLDHAQVTATYRMTNGGKVDAHADVAFVMVASEGGNGSVEASIAIDGQPVALKVVTEADVLRPQLVAWLAAHPDAEKELARLAKEPDYTDTDALRKLVPCRSDCSDLVRWYRNQDDAEAMRRAADEAIPSEAAKVQSGWTKRADSGPISWLTFRLDIAAGASRAVRVQYTHVAGWDTSVAVNQVFSYVYFLSPAKRWARFGDLHVEVQVPPDTLLRTSSITLSPDEKGTTYRADLASLPNGELTFDLMSRRGLLFGMSQPIGYWIILIGIMALVTIPASARLGRAWGRASSRFRAILGCIFGTGISAFVWNIAIALALSAAFPSHAFGNHYSAFAGFFLLLILFVIGAIVISLAATRAKMPKTATPD